MCAMYYYASKLTAAALSGGGLIGGGGGGGNGSSSGDGGGRVCRCHEAQKEQRSSPRRASTPQSAKPARQPSRVSRVHTPTLGPSTTEHVVIEHPRPNHYHRHRTKHKVRGQLRALRSQFFHESDCIIFCKADFISTYAEIKGEGIRCSNKFLDITILSGNFIREILI